MVTNQNLSHFTEYKLGKNNRAGQNIILSFGCRDVINDLGKEIFTTTFAELDLGYPWRHQAITWTNVYWPSAKSSDIHIRAISQDMPQTSNTKICLKITWRKFHSIFPGANELTNYELSYLRVRAALHPSLPSATQVVVSLASCCFQR